MEKAKVHYVDNKLFFAEMERWKTEIEESDEVDDLPPMVTEYMGECFYKIATHLSYRPNFINYTYREEMIGDGIENCIRYAKNFNPEKSKNPFAYFTQIIYYAFIRRITKEKKQSAIKQKIIDNTATPTYDVMEGDDTVYENTYIEFLRDNLDEQKVYQFILNHLFETNNINLINKIEISFCKICLQYVITYNCLKLK